MPDYKTWCPDDGGEEKADDCIGYCDAKAAALDHARDRWRLKDEPWEQTVYAREEDGTLRVFIVTTKVKPIFTAEEVTR
jgi:hypothetical protein